MKRTVLFFVVMAASCACGGNTAKWELAYPYETNGTAFFEHIAKRTVLIQTSAIFNGNRNVYYTGAGAVIGSEGTVLTANHVVSGPFTDIQIYQCELTPDRSNIVCGHGVAGRVLRRSATEDIALLKMRDAHNLPKFALGRSKSLVPGNLLWRVGMDVTGWAAGPLLRSRGCGTQLEILTPASGGASGGPVVNGAGALVGIVTSTPNAEIASRIVTFAVPIDRIRDRVLSRSRRRN